MEGRLCLSKNRLWSLAVFLNCMSCEVTFRGLGEKIKAPRQAGRLCVLTRCSLFLNFPVPTLAYVTYQDIRAVGNFKEQTVIAVKAPPQTRLEVPDRAEVRRETLGGGQGRKALDSSVESSWHYQPQLHWSILGLGTSLVCQRFFSLHSLFRGYCAHALGPHRSQIRAPKNPYLTC